MAIADRKLPDVAELAESAEGAVVLPVDPASREVVYTEPGSVPKVLGDVDVVFPVLHGPYGEDGTLQGLLDLSGMPYVGCGRPGLGRRHGQGVHEAGLHLLRADGRPVPGDPAARVGAGPRGARRIVDFAGEHGWPLFIKPARAGSSIGITKVDSFDGLDEAIEEARSHDPKIIVEALLAAARSSAECWSSRTGRVRACRPRSRRSGPRLLRLRGQVHRLGVRHRARAAHRRADGRVQRLAVEAFDAASCEGLVRADFFLTEDGEFVINEINTLPGFTPISMYPRMWQESGVSYQELVDRLIQAALNRSTGLR